MAAQSVLVVESLLIPNMSTHSVGPAHTGPMQAEQNLVKRGVLNGMDTRNSIDTSSAGTLQEKYFILMCGLMEKNLEVSNSILSSLAGIKSALLSLAVSQSRQSQQPQQPPSSPSAPAANTKPQSSAFKEPTKDYTRGKYDGKHDEKKR
jgi:hypothetical protein